jgi:hypothetical protein
MHAIDFVVRYGFPGVGIYIGTSLIAALLSNMSPGRFAFVILPVPVAGCVFLMILMFGSH